MEARYTIRKAVEEDERAICGLFEEMLRTIYGTPDVDGYENGYLDKFWDRGEDRIFVAEDTEVRAFLSVEIYREPEAYAYFDDFSVTEACRNRGLGTVLLRTAEAYVKERGIPAIVFHVEKRNAAAQRLYERSGYSIFRDDGSRYLMRKLVP